MSTDSSHGRAGQRTAFGHTAGFLWNLLGFWLKLMLFIMVGYVCSVLVEWTGMALGMWEEHGALHSETMYRTEYNYIRQDLANGLFRGGTLGLVDHAVGWAHDVVTPSPGGYASQVASWMVSPIVPTDWHIVEWGKKVTESFMAYFLAARNIALVYVLRLTIILLSLPLFIVIIHAAFIDGLTQRERRKAGGGIESGFVYHHLKRLRGIVLLFPLVIYLASPVSTHPNVALLPIAFVLWFLNYVFVAKFKKHL